ncbi:Brr6/Brl1 family protein ASCRUDRAFT_21749, partial [Ascoidea rubescens DSM 1968]
PYVISSYIQLIVNIMTSTLIIYLIISLYRTIKNDISLRLQQMTEDLMLEALICKKQYVENHCEPENVVPALEKRCLEWSKCFNKDFNAAFYNSSIGAETLGQVINSLIEPIGFKALLVGGIGLVVWVFISNVLFGYIR